MNGIGVREQTTIVGVSDFIYVIAGPLLALNPTDGTVAWRFDDSNGEIRNVAVTNGVAYVFYHDGVSAVRDGNEDWRTDDVSGRFLTSTDDHVVVEHSSGVSALDRTSGTSAWTIEFDGGFRSTVRNELAYGYTPVAKRGRYGRST